MESAEISGWFFIFLLAIVCGGVWDAVKRRSKGKRQRYHNRHGSMWDMVDDDGPGVGGKGRIPYFKSIDLDEGKTSSFLDDDRFQ